MHIAHAISHLAGGRCRVALATPAAACCALALGGTATASAAGPAIIGPGANVIIPSWCEGLTTA